MLRTFLLLSLFAVVLDAHAQEANNAQSQNASASALQLWDEARFNTYMLGQRRRSSGTIASAVGAGMLTLGAAGIGAPAVAIGAVFALVGGVQAISGSVKVLEAIDNRQPRERQSLPQAVEPESTAAQSPKPESVVVKSWKPEVGGIVFFELDGAVMQGQVLKANMDESQYRVEYDSAGKKKSKWIYRKALFEKAANVEK